MGGSVAIQSVLNEGTEVHIMLPAKEFEITEEAEFIVEFPKKIPTSSIKDIDLNDYTNENLSESSVLVVEDNDELRDFIGGLLRPDYTVYMAKNGNEGIKVAYQFIPDIIISDVMMPEKDGNELCTVLKNDERTSHIPIIMLTAKDTVQNSREGYLSGADDYVLKPFDNELLKLKIKNVIATHEAKRRQFDLKSVLSSENIKPGDADRQFLKKCFSVIEKNIDNPDFSVDNLAEELAFGKRNFYRKIIAITNQTPAEIIRVFRLQYARKLLQNHQMKVFEIASLVGYSDVNSFRRAYKNQFGSLPSERTENKSI